MRPSFVFISSCAVTAMVWVSLWPRRVGPPPSPHAPPSAAADDRWTRKRITSLVAAVENAKTDEERLAACTDLLQIPLPEAQELLEKVEIRSGNGLSLVAKTLLIRWASADGEAAVNWAWKRFRGDGAWHDGWYHAFDEIGPAWAAHDPAGFAKWGLRAAERRKADSKSAPVADAVAADFPLLESNAFDKIPEWLLSEDPRLAYQVLGHAGPSASATAFPLALNSVAKVREALLAFDNLDKLDPERVRDDDYAPKMLLRRWQELDPADFNRSQYAKLVLPDKDETIVLEEWKSAPPEKRAGTASGWVNDTPEPFTQKERICAIADAWSEIDPAATARWLDSLPPEHNATTRPERASILAPTDLEGTLDWVDSLPTEERRSSWVPAFDAWNKAHPGEQPEMSGWSESRRRAWSDLQAAPRPLPRSGG